MKRYRDAGHTAPDGLSAVLLGRADVGATLVADSRVALVSATGSTRMGRAVGEACANGLPAASSNSAATTPPSSRPRRRWKWWNAQSPSPQWAPQASVAQRCAACWCTQRVATRWCPDCKRSTASCASARPLDEGTLVGPLIDAAAFSAMQSALADARAAGGHVTGGGEVMQSLGADAYYVQPAMVEMPAQSDAMCRETFAPILYVVKYEGDVDRPSRSTTRCRTACRRASSLTTCARWSAFSARPAR